MAITSTPSDLLTALLPEWQLLLQQWSSSGRLTAAAQEALLLNGKPQALTDLVTQWTAGDFSGIPPIVLLSGAEMNGAMGAYAISTGSIYLNVDWLATATKDQVFAVLTEELGHYLDSALNQKDTAGDEGEFFARLLGWSTLSDAEKAALRSQIDAGVVLSGGIQVTVENAVAPLIRGNSFYQRVLGPTWTSAEANSVTIGGHLATVNSASENQWLFNNSLLGWIGYTDQAVEGQWRWISGEVSTYSNWSPNNPDNGGGIENYAYIDGGAGIWNDIPNDYWNYIPGTSPTMMGISEIPLQLTITRQGEVKEGAGLFTTSINLFAGSTTSGNLADGAQVWWNVTGITADDLTAGALSGTGTIQNGKLDIQHSLKVDPDSGESFEVSVFSDAGLTQQIGTTSSVLVQEAKSVIRGNSFYQVVAGPTWDDAESSAIDKGGHLVTLNDTAEDSYIFNSFIKASVAPTDYSDHLWIGLRDVVTEGAYTWSSGESVSYLNIDPINYVPNLQFIEVKQDWVLYWGQSGTWDTQEVLGYPLTGRNGIAEIPLQLSITRQGEVKEGAGLFTTSINLSAGTEASGNLADGSQVWWNVTGITADDLASGALSGTGTIQNGKLDIQHSLKVDPDSGESFDVFVFSDAGLTQQIGTTSSVLVQEAKSVIRANSLYTVDNGPSWTEAEANAVVLGGHLVSVQDAEENLFIGSIILATGTESVTYWIGLTDSAVEGEWKWSSGESLTYTNWSPGEPNAFDQVAGPEDYAALYATTTPSWFDISNGNEYFRGRGFQSIGIAEIPLQLSITRQGEVKEGAGLFTTSINLSAGTEASGNLADGSQVWWSVTGITADDLVTGALSGTGTIQNGKLDIQHSLKVDPDSGESFEVSVFSDAGLTQQIGLKSVAAIIDGNNAPTDIASSSINFNENIAANSPVATFTTTDPDVGNTFTYSLVAGIGSTDNSAFTISGNQLLINTSPNFEAKSSYSVRLRSADQGGLFTEKVFTYVVNDLNEAPTDIASSSSNFNENIAANSPVATFTTTDPDVGNTFTYSLVTGTGSTDNSAFTISGNQLLISASPNFEAKSSYSIRLRSADQGALFTEKVFTYGVNNLNEAPTDITSSSINFNENIAANSPVATFTTTDPDATNTFTYSLVTGIGSTDNSSFTISGNQLLISASPNFEAKSSYSIRLRSADQGALFTEKVFTYGVNNLQEGPAQFNLKGDGTCNLNQTLTCLLAQPDPDGLKAATTYAYKWESSTTGSSAWTALTGTASTYALQSTDTNKYVRCTVSYTDALNLATSVVTSNIHIVGGTTGSNTLVGGTGVDIEDGGAGNDVLQSGAGDDFVGGGIGDDTFTATTGDGNDFCDGGAGIDTVNFNLSTSSVTVDLLTGTAVGVSNGTDKLVNIENIVGSTLNDSLIGNNSVNTFRGNGGADTFSFLNKQTAGASTSDHITDFSADDKILVSKSAFGITASVVTFATASTPASLTAGLATASLFVYDSTNGNLYWNQNGTAAGAGTGGVFAVLDNRFGLTASNINLVA